MAHKYDARLALSLFLYRLVPFLHHHTLPVFVLSLRYNHSLSRQALALFDLDFHLKQEYVYDADGHNARLM